MVLVSFRGPSPLARGALRLRLQAPRKGRTIPARAGSTGGPAWTGVARWDHPRSRGEHAGRSPSIVRPSGPSPLARGARRLPAPAHLPGGTIPARAGSTRAAPAPPAPTRDHPRSRGEHPDVGGVVMLDTGPSPLARGARARCRSRSRWSGTIPARAGSTIGDFNGQLSMRDHPRSRGEHATIPGDHPLREGPSPLARGARLLE